MADAVAIIVISAGVAAIVSSVALAWNGWRERLSRVSLQQMEESNQATLRDLDRRHEAHLRDLDRRQEVAIRDLDRKHERSLHELADLRARRDLKAERLRTHLLDVTDAALKFGDREFDLRMNPRRFADPAPGVEQARERLNDLRPVLVLETKSERLLRAMADLARQYDTYLIALRRWQGQTETTTAATRTGPGMPAATSQQEAFQQAKKRGDSLARSVQEVIESAREALGAIEQPIA